MQSTKRTGRFGDSRGFSLLELAVAVAIVSVISGMAVFGLRSARAAMRLNNSARVFAQNVERARLDAIRRHDTASVEFTSPTTYDITMDFTGNGVKTTRSFTLDGGITLVNATGTTITDEFPYADFDWRGRTSECAMFFQMKNTQDDMLKVQVAGSGDITVNNNVTGVPNVSYYAVNANTDIAPNTIAGGTDTRLNASPCGTNSSSSSSSGTSAVCTAGTLSLNQQYVTVRRNGGSTQTVTATVTTSGTLSAVPSSSNISVTTTGTQNVGSPNGGSVSYQVRSTDRTRGTFAVKFNFSNCSPATLYVKVVN